MTSTRRTELIPCRRWLHTHTLGVGAAIALGLALSPAAASAAIRGASTNSSADLSALTAYHVYLNALSANSDASASADSAVVNTVANNCSNALADLNKLSASQLKKSALTSFGNEVDADLALAYVSTSRTALNRFADVLDGLTWATSSQSQTTARLISSERALLGTGQSDICADATTLDAAPLSEPTTTQRFLVRYRTASKNLRATLAAFQTLLGRFETASERRLVAQINTLVSQFSSQSSVTEQTDAATVLSDLGVQS